MKHAAYTWGESKPIYSPPLQKLRCRFGKHEWFGSWCSYGTTHEGPESEYWCVYCEDPIRRRAVKGNNPGERPKRKHVKR